MLFSEKALVNSGVNEKSECAKDNSAKYSKMNSAAKFIISSSSGSRGGRGGHGPPGPVKIGHKKDGRQRQPHRFHVSRPPPLPGRWIRY